MGGESRRTIEAGETAPVFSLSSADGQECTLQNSLTRGPLLAAFFRAPCPAWRYKFPFVERLHRLRSLGAKDVQIWGIVQDSADRGRDFAGDYGVTFPIFAGDEPFETPAQYTLDHVPTLFLISKNRCLGLACDGFSKADLLTLYQCLAKHDAVKIPALFQPADRVPAYQARLRVTGLGLLQALRSLTESRNTDRAYSSLSSCSRASFLCLGGFSLALSMRWPAGGTPNRLRARRRTSFSARKVLRLRRLRALMNGPSGRPEAKASLQPDSFVGRELQPPESVHAHELDAGFAARRFSIRGSLIDHSEFRVAVGVRTREHQKGSNLKFRAEADFGAVLGNLQGFRLLFKVLRLRVRARDNHSHVHRQTRASAPRRCALRRAVTSHVTSPRRPKKLRKLGSVPILLRRNRNFNILHQTEVAISARSVGKRARTPPVANVNVGTLGFVKCAARRRLAEVSRNRTDRPDRIGTTGFEVLGGHQPTCTSAMILIACRNGVNLADTARRKIKAWLLMGHRNTFSKPNPRRART